jgi:hypothetical protein
LPVTPDTKTGALAQASEFSLVQLGGQSWTLFQLPSVDAAKQAESVIKVAARNFSLHHAYWTTGCYTRPPQKKSISKNIVADPDAKNAVSMRQFVILVGVPASTSKEAVIRSLPSNLRVVGVWIYLDQGLAVLQLPQAVSQDTLRTVVASKNL